MFSHLFHRRHKTPQPRFAQGLFLLLVAVFVILMNSRPVLALAGLGTTLILAAALVELNREGIWTGYKQAYKKQKGWKGNFTSPNQVYYRINVWYLWPFIGFLGVVCLYAAYIYA